MTLPPDPLSEYCKALGHPARMQILRLLIEKGECISGDLADELPLAASTISEHLRILKEAGLIKGSVDGPRRCYCVDAETLAKFKHLITSL
jgi:ArsR family transcriptional regulator, arsenate/arsenite/antimonite-responsive transcriptional repressor